MEVKAFPNTPTFDQDANRTVWQEGMDLRDYFAAKAMCGQLANAHINTDVSYGHLAKCSYEIADAMMEARNGNKK